jgi:hypothetical protein
MIHQQGSLKLECGLYSNTHIKSKHFGPELTRIDIGRKFFADVTDGWLSE